MGQRARFPVDFVFLYAGGRGEPRRTATSFCPRRAAKDREELQHLLSTEDTEGRGERQLQRQLLFCPRRAAKNCNCNTFCPRRTRRATENGNCNGNFFFVHEGPRRTAKNCNGIFLLSAGDTEGGGERSGFFWAAGAARLECAHKVGEGWFWRGALRGRSPCTREGRRPDRPELQWLVEGGG